MEDVKCPACGLQPKVKKRGIINFEVRLECVCGVSGAWIDSSEGDDWDNAAKGWIHNICGDPPVNEGLRWNKTADGLPKKPGKRRYEQIECLIMLPNGYIEISAWNCEHEVWDDAEGDDFLYDQNHPTHWIAIETLRAAISAQPA